MPKMNIRIIKSENEYQDAVSRVTTLAMMDPETDTHEAEQLEILALLIEDYEKKYFTFDAPDPISAIEFRMEEQGLRQRDLISILGSRSRVSEVLGRKRPLSLQMIRSLSESLGIPTDVLIRPIQNTSSEETSLDQTDWMKFPFKEMQRRGWIPNTEREGSSAIAAQVKEFLHQATSTKSLVPLFRRTLKGLGVGELEERASYSAVAWTARIIQRANDRASELPKFQLDALSEQYFRELVQLSRYEDGPLKAVSHLKRIGVCVVIEPQLPGTLIDGAALLTGNSQPAIGLTLRYDRIDYFWFTLLHELAHVWKHLNEPNESFVDRIDANDANDRTEKEANRIAREAIVPRTIWTKSAARLSPSPQSIGDLARSLGVHPALVAGRVRHESGDFSRFSKLLGHGTLRKMFGI